MGYRSTVTDATITAANGLPLLCRATGDARSVETPIPIDDLTIAIGTLGDQTLLKSCLDSIFSEDSPDLRYRVWVVSNGPPTDGAPARLTARYPTVRLIEKDGPLGYCVTYNLVLRQCRSRYVLLLDEDTIVKPGTLASMVRFMDAHRDVGIAGCKTLNPDGSFQKTYGLVPSLRTEFLNAFLPDSFWPARLYRDTSRVRDVEWLNGSFMLVRSEVIATVGTLDERYYTYVCEADWCYRIRKAGWRVAYVPHSKIIHIGGQHSINNKRTAQDSVRLVRYHVNRYYFFQKHYGPRSVLLLRPLMLVGACLRLLRYGALYLSSAERRRPAAVRMRTFWDVIKLSLGSRPYEMPRRFARGAAVVGPTSSDGSYPAKGATGR